MTETSSDAIASYFADLLSEVPSANDQATRVAGITTASAVTAQEPPPVVKMSSPAPVVERFQATHQDDALKTLEQSKKQQLQALLNSQLLNAAPEAMATEVEAPQHPPVEIAAVNGIAPVVPKHHAPESKTMGIIEVANVDVANKEIAITASHLDTPIDVAGTSQANTRAHNPYLAWAENGRPLWAQKQFDILLFQVAGLNLAVPLIALGHIHPLTDELAPVFGQIDWFMGFQPTPAGAIRAVNTALFVMPERYDPKFLNTAKYVVSIDGMDWGLAVDSVRNPTTLQPEDVTWRSQRSKRPWLAGTVKSAMCALLDIPQIGHLLQSHDRKRHVPA